MMQQITNAYKEDDLLALLSLQTKLRDGKEHLETLPDETLKYYNKVLKQQVFEIEKQIYFFKHLPTTNFFFHDVMANPKMADILKDQHELKDETIMFENKNALRKYLKTLGINNDIEFSHFDLSFNL